MRRDELAKLFEGVDDAERQVVDRLLDEVVFLEDEMAELKKLPFIKTKPDNASIQKTTPAAKLYKECSQSYMNAVRILINVLRKVQISAESDLMQMLKQYEV